MVTLSINSKGDEFTGKYGILRAFLELKDQNRNTISRLSANAMNIYQGAKVKGDSGFYPLYVSSTVWVSAGQRLHFTYFIYELSNMAEDVSRITLLKSTSYLKIVKLL